MTHGRSFKPNNRFDANGDTLAPERGKSWELGLKTDLLDGGLQMTTALFNIVKNNVATTDPNDADARIAAGEVRSRGLDVSLSGNLGRNTRVVGYAAWLDAEVTKDNTLTPGAPINNVPRRRLSLMAFHGFSGSLSALEVGAALQYVSERYSSSAANAIRMAGYSTVDLMSTYQINRNVTLRATLRNLFDRAYIERPFNTNGYPGEPRTLYVGLNLKL